MKAHSPSEEREDISLLMARNGPTGAVEVSTACVYCHLRVVFCVQLHKKNRYLLTFAGQEFFKGLFPPDAFLQGWPENR